jgi:two-component system chemotaxis sensor kinase CheA
MTRALGSELGKQVTTEVEFGDLLVAPQISRIVGEILVHAVRNSADHGIESPAERLAAGKNPSGTIRVLARQKRDRLIVLVCDDGRGIDLDRVRATAVQRRLVDAGLAMTDAEIIELLFTPGFSTMTTVSAVSGRGVGMDVIRCLVEEQGGTVSLRSAPGHGTELRLDLPLAAS